MVLQHKERPTINPNVWSSLDYARFTGQKKGTVVHPHLTLPGSPRDSTAGLFCPKKPQDTLKVKQMKENVLNIKQSPRKLTDFWHFHRFWDLSTFWPVFIFARFDISADRQPLLTTFLPPPPPLLGQFLVISGHTSHPRMRFDHPKWGICPRSETMSFWHITNNFSDRTKIWQSFLCKGSGPLPRIDWGDLKGKPAATIGDPADCP